MASRSRQQQKTNASHNVSNFKDRKYIAKGRKSSQDQDDTASDSTTTPSVESLCGSNVDSDQDWRSSGTKGSPPNSPGSPPNSPPSSKTSLRSLQSKAKMFVPTDANLAMMPMMMPCVPPPCMPTPGKDCLAGVIQSTLGGELWNLNMMDYTSYSGEWQTAVEITIPALNASTCHLVTSQDANACDAAQQKNLSQAIQSLTQALEGLKPNIVIQPADNTASICLTFCAADKTRLCQEFSHFGSCPRGGTCRWAHAMVETFMINFILAPLAQWNCCTAMQPQSHGGQAIECKSSPSTKAPQTAARWQPSRPPIAGPEEMQRPSMKNTDSTPGPDNATAQSSAVEDIGAGKFEPLKSLAPDVRPKNPRFASRKKWCDIEEDSDDDVCLLFGNAS